MSGKEERRNQESPLNFISVYGLDLKAGSEEKIPIYLKKDIIMMYESYTGEVPSKQDGIFVKLIDGTMLCLSSGHMCYCYNHVNEITEMLK